MIPISECVTSTLNPQLVQPRYIVWIRLEGRIRTSDGEIDRPKSKKRTSKKWNGSTSLILESSASTK